MVSCEVDGAGFWEGGWCIMIGGVEEVGVYTESRGPTSELKKK